MCGCPACAARTPTLADYARQQAAIDQYEQEQARDEARRNEHPASPQTDNLEPKGCVFAKSCSLPNGLINHDNPGGFIPVELLSQYGPFALLASDSAETAASTPLAWIGGTSTATALTRRLGGTLSTSPPGLKVLAAVLMPDTTPLDRALYTLDQYGSLAMGKTRARIHVERLADDSVRAYGFYTGNNKEWESVPVVAANADGDRLIVELGQGLKLILTLDAVKQTSHLKDAQPLAPVWVYPPTDAADKTLVKPVHPPLYQDRIVWFPNTNIPPFYISFSVTTTCTHPDMMEQLAEYIAGEMNRNIHDPAVLEMRRLIDYDPVAEEAKYEHLAPIARLRGPPSYHAIAMKNKAAAAVIWTQKVGQGQDWDHKPKLRKIFPKVHHKQGQYDYFYDIWSNIHYGYVGIIGGISESVLLDGAGAEQIVTDIGNRIGDFINPPKVARKLPGPRASASPWTDFRSWDDVADRVSISIGVKLASQYRNGGITSKIIMDEVLAVSPNNWGDGIRAHICD
ncbi:polymorphic toxin type 44 domain-containing protein [Rhodococcus sp. IEGM1300]